MIRMHNLDVVPVCVTMDDGSIEVTSIVVTEYDKDNNPVRGHAPSTSYIDRIVNKRRYVDAYQVGEKVVHVVDSDPVPPGAVLLERMPRVQSWRLMADEEFELHQVQGADREMRAGLRDDGQKITHDLTVCRALRMAKLRAQRNDKLTELDREWMKNTGQGKKTEADQVEAKRQALRDAPVTLTPAIEAAQTVEELKAVKLPE